MTAPAGGSEDRTPGGTSAGETLKGRYRLLRPLATSHRSDLWTARDELLERTVLVKLLRLEPGDVAVRERFRSEALAAARLSHPGIVAVYDTLLEAGITGVVLEHVEATPLSRFLHDSGPISLGEALSVALQIADALAVAHDRGVRHCNLSPDSVWLCGDQRVKITDFGTAWAHRRSAPGNAPTAAWEQEQADIRALAGVLRDCLMPGGTSGVLPDELADFLATAETPQHGARFNSIAEARSLLATVRGELPPPDIPDFEFAASEPGAPATARDPAPRSATGRRRGRRVLAATLIAAGVAAALAVVNLTGDNPPAPDLRLPDPPVVTTGATALPPTGEQPALPGDVPAESDPTESGAGSDAAESQTPEVDEAVPPTDPGVAIVGARTVTFRQEDTAIDDPDALRVLDGDTSTYWATPGLNAGDRTVGGVGLEFRLAEPTVVSQMVITSESVGWEAAVFVGDGDHDQLSDWGPLIDQQTNAAGQMVFGLADQQAAAVLLWIPDPRAALTEDIRIAEVVISAVPDATVR